MKLLHNGVEIYLLPRCLLTLVSSCIHLSSSYVNLKFLSYTVGNEIVALKQLHILDP